MIASSHSGAILITRVCHQFACEATNQCSDREVENREACPSCVAILCVAQGLGAGTRDRFMNDIPLWKLEHVLISRDKLATAA